MRTKPTTARLSPSQRPPPALPPRTTRRSVSATWDWSISPRTECSVAATSAIIAHQKSHDPTCLRSIRVMTKPVTKSGLGDDDTRRRRVPFNLPAEVCDEYAQILSGIAECATPDGIEDLLMAHGMAGV